LVKLAEKHPDKLHAITLNVDYEGGAEAGPDEDTLKKVQRVLDKFAIDLDNLVCTTASDDVLSDLGAGAGLPTVVVFNKQGEKIKLFDGQFSYEEDVTPLVEDLIAAEPSK
jgi:hypothetical protein